MINSLDYIQDINQKTKQLSLKTSRGHYNFTDLKPHVIQKYTFREEIGEFKEATASRIPVENNLKFKFTDLEIDTKIESKVSKRILILIM